MALSNPSIVTIPAGILDPYYRYKRPTVRVKSNKKNGATTIVENFDAIVTALGFSLSQNKDKEKEKNGNSKVPISASEGIRKLVQKTLCTRVNIVKSSSSSFKTELMICGNFSAKEIDAIIEVYIEINCCCKVCRSPELVNGTCNACGNRQ